MRGLPCMMRRFLYTPGIIGGGKSYKIQDIDNIKQVITLSQDATNEIKVGNRYFFQNLFEELDAPGEWYFDRRKKILYYYPVDHADLKTVTLPVLDSILEIRGKRLGNKYYGIPSHIRFEGFTFEGCNGSAIVLRGAQNTSITRSKIKHAGGNGIEILDGRDNMVLGNDVYDIGGTGVVISAGDRETLLPVRHRVENNHIWDTGVFEKGGASGILCRGVGHVVSHNMIHSMPRVGIWLDGNDHLIEYNHIHHVNQETEDSGAIYFGQIDWTKRGNIVQYNYIHHSGGFGWDARTRKWRSPFYTFGIYLDDWASGTKVYGNIIKDTVSGGIFIHSGRDNVIGNNIIIDGGHSGQMVYSAWPLNSPTAQKHLPAMFSKVEGMVAKYPLLSTITDIPTGAKMSGNSFIRNIVVYRDAAAPLYGIYNDFDLDTTISNYNVIYTKGNLPLIPFTKVAADRQWLSWQNQGMDRNSVIADPLLADPANSNFSLHANSPALKHGFKPIPFDKIGPYKDPLRASWPILE